MKLITQLYIDTIDDISQAPVYERIELFDFEDIELTSTIQDIRDVGAVFTDYSRDFVVPASNNNSKVFKHFYNVYVSNGFDARIKRRAKILLNGVLFRQGFIRLSEVTMKSNDPYSYKLTFLGSLVQLSDIIGDDKLSDLQGLSQFTHDFDEQTVWDAFRTGLGLSGGNIVVSTDRDVIYPAISSEASWFYDSSGNYGDTVFEEGVSRNLARDPANINVGGISWIDLKPAIKVIRIIEAIEATYDSITFSRDFFGKDIFNELYLLLHSNKGNITDESEVEKVIRLQLTGETDDFPIITGDGDLRPFVTNTKDINASSYLIDVNITSVLAIDALYDIKVYNGGELLGSRVGVTGDNTVQVALESKNLKTWDNIFVEVSSINTISFDVDIDVIDENISGNRTSNYTISDSSISTLQELIINKHLPEINVQDFLKGLFNMFNLTAELVSDVIVVKDLYSFYRDGNSYDWTDLIDTTDVVVKRSQLYDDIKFKYAEPKTYGVFNQNEENQDDFGNLEFQATENGRSGSLIFDGERYEINLPFEKLFFPVMNDEVDSTATTFGSGWLVDKDQKSTTTKPVLFFNNPSTIDIGTYEMEFRTKGLISTYNRPTSVSSDQSLTLHFGGEIDEFSGVLEQNSIFAVLYQQYIEGLFTKTTRLLSLNAKLNLNTLLSYRMNDKITYRGVDYRINSINTKLTTGLTELELITDFSPYTDTLT